MRKNRRLLFSLLCTLIILVLAILSDRLATVPGLLQGTGSTPVAQGRSQDVQWGVRAKTTGCQVNGPLQDKTCTPGDIFPDVTKAQICTPGYASSVRDVPQSVKSQVYAAYGIAKRSPGQYEVDHLVSLQLGGSNDISNLWPEAAKPVPGFHEKDKVENFLHDEVCAGKISLKEAQVEIATNWLTVYNRMSANG